MVSALGEIKKNKEEKKESEKNFRDDPEAIFAEICWKQTVKKLKKLSGAKRTRTADPLHAMQVLYQLSYGPNNYKYTN